MSPNISQSVIKIRDLKFLDFISYPNFDILGGRCNFLSGESGCGKSTLFRLINTTLSPSGGYIEYMGKNIEKWDSIELRKEIILTSQEVFLFDGTIEENFKIYYDFREEECITKDKMKTYLSICSADFPLDLKCEILSGGERQRVFTAICLSFLPKIILLDEPTAALDEVTSHKFFRQIKEFCLNYSITLIVICHNNNLVEAYADEIIRLDKR